MNEDEKENELRDLFAAHALGGLIAGGFYTNRDSVDAAVRAYDLADALIEERQERIVTRGENG
jgi:hypothetical protein